jgi:hypothetical protein
LAVAEMELVALTTLDLVVVVAMLLCLGFHRLLLQQ